MRVAEFKKAAINTATLILSNITAPTTCRVNNRKSTETTVQAYNAHLFGGQAALRRGIGVVLGVEDRCVGQHPGGLLQVE
jgi:hypothetical protein